LDMGQTKQDTWVGAVEVKPKQGNTMFGKAPGAFTNVVCRAKSVAEFEDIVKLMLGRMELDVLEIEDVARLSQILEDGEVDEELVELANQLSDKVTFLYDTFYVYDSPDDRIS